MELLIFLQIQQEKIEELDELMSIKINKAEQKFNHRMEMISKLSTEELNMLIEEDKNDEFFTTVEQITEIRDNEIKQAKSSNAKSNKNLKDIIKSDYRKGLKSINLKFDEKSYALGKESTKQEELFHHISHEIDQYNTENKSDLLSELYLSTFQANSKLIIIKLNNLLKVNYPNILNQLKEKVTINEIQCRAIPSM